MDDYYDNDGKWDEKEEAGTSVHHKKNNVLPLWGNERSMNLNPLILTNIQSSHYFKVNLYELKTYHEVIDEIYYKVSHLEPWEKGSRKTAGQTGMCGGVRGVGAGGIVSTAFCLLYKLFTLKLTRKQVIGLITHPDSPYIRVLGFMYIRYTQPPADLWDWYEPYLDDTEELDVKAGGGQIMTIGNILKNFLCKLEWFSTLFPRIPVPIQQKLEKKMNEKYPPPAPSARRIEPAPAPTRSTSRTRRTPETGERNKYSAPPKEYGREERTTKSPSTERLDRLRARAAAEDRYRERSPYIRNGGGDRSGSREHTRDRYRDRPADRDYDRYKEEDRHRERRPRSPERERERRRSVERQRPNSPRRSSEYIRESYVKSDKHSSSKSDRSRKPEYEDDEDGKYREDCYRKSHTPDRHRSHKSKKDKSNSRDDSHEHRKSDKRRRSEERYYEEDSRRSRYE